MTILQTIEKGAQDRRLVAISYVDSAGDSTQRKIEPYEIKNGKVWGYCHSRDAIRQFAIHQILSASITDEVFEPRWAVKL